MHVFVRGLASGGGESDDVKRESEQAPWGAASGCLSGKAAEFSFFERRFENFPTFRRWPAADIGKCSNETAAVNCFSVWFE